MGPWVEMRGSLRTGRLRVVGGPVLVLGALLTVGPGAEAAMPQARSAPGPPPEGLPLYVPVPESNPPMPGKVALGRRLFFDPVLSADRSVSCASCHRPEHAFADSTARSLGARGARPPRNTPSLLNAAYGGPYLWDGRTSTLEEQVLLPVAQPREMALPLTDAVARLRADSTYRRAFGAAFPTVTGDEPGVTRENLGRALASYVRTLRAGNSPADRFAAGAEDAVSLEARRGYALFVGKAGCTRCHGGPLFTDERFHNTGVGWGGPDAGRTRITGRPEDRGLFNTPSLRNVAETAPYMHDGSMETLHEVVRFYVRGGGSNPNLDRRLEPLDLTEAEIDALVAYLRAMTSPGPGSQPRRAGS